MTNDARYYLATSDCKLKRQGLSIWPFQIQRGGGEEEDITTHLWAQHLLDINSLAKANTIQQLLIVGPIFTKHL